MNAETISLLQAIIPAAISAIVTYLVASKQNRTTVTDINQKHNEQMALILYRLEQLEKKMDKHNDFIKRLGILETKVEFLNGKKNG